VPIEPAHTATYVATHVATYYTIYYVATDALHRE
jgi:hypothetical protein